MQGQASPGFVTLGNWWNQQFNDVLNPTLNGYIFGDDEFIVQICNTQEINIYPESLFQFCISIPNIQNMLIYPESNQTIFIEVSE